MVIDDGNGYRSIYAHFSKVVVKRGQVVKAGDFLGYEGMTGRASGCHVHYGLFSPLETATFGIDPAVVKRMKLPDTLIARIDPLLVLPPRPQDQPSGVAIALDVVRPAIPVGGADRLSLSGAGRGQPPRRRSAGEAPIATADERVAGDPGERLTQ